MSITDTLAIAIRAYAEPIDFEPPKSTRGNDEPSIWSLVFDCETTTDACQRLRFGSYQVRKGLVLHQAGLFYDPDALTPDELAELTAYARDRQLRLLTCAEFVDKVFYKIGYDRRGTIIGFNLPFDLSRVAIGHSPARGSMRGGFSLTLSDKPWWPNVRVKHLSRRAALIDFAVPPGQETARGERNRGLTTPAHRGFFVDVSTVAAALMSEGFTLERLCLRLKTRTQKLANADHGAPITPAYLDYACADVQATWECFVVLKGQYEGHKLSTSLHRVLSEASIGKAYLKDMGIRPLLECQPDIPRGLFGKIMGGYFGGRAEVHWRRTIQRVLYCDFKSMYPTVNALMGLWPFVIADRLRWADGTEDARRILEHVTAEMLLSKAAWRNLHYIVRIQPDADLLPVRAAYNPDSFVKTIGVNYLTCPTSIWVTLADCIAAKILSGKAPTILEAIHFEPGAPQSGLQPIDLFGDPRYRVDPCTEDVFARLVDLRDEAKARHDPLQKVIKIIANAVSYGIYIEILRDDAPSREQLKVYGLSGGRRLVDSKAVEEPGRYFHPLLGVLITGAARLMLALAERQVLDAGLDWAFCDTDSLAIVKPDDMSEARFVETAQTVVDKFEALNPYRAAGSILKIEDQNFQLGDDQ